jgi:hypothetical protein
VTSTRAQADEQPYKPAIVPECKSFIVPGVGEVCGFLDVEDWKKVLKADAELVHSRGRLKKEEARAANLMAQVKSLRDQVAVYAETQHALVAQNDKLTKDLIDLDKKYQDERVRPRWGSPVAWTIAAVSTSILAGVLIEGLLD